MEIDVLTLSNAFECKRNVGSPSANQRNTIQMAFRWRAMVVCFICLQGLYALLENIKER